MIITKEFDEIRKRRIYEFVRSMSLKKDIHLKQYIIKFVKVQVNLKELINFIVFIMRIDTKDVEVITLSFIQDVSFR